MTDYPWQKFYPDGVQWDQTFDSKPLYELLDDVVAKFPDNTALDFLGKKYSYYEFRSLVNKAAKGLQSIGVRTGTKVGLFLPNCPQFVIFYYAILKAGATVVNYSPLYAISEIKHQIEDSQTEIMITLNLKELYPKLQKILNETKVGESIFSKIIVGTLQEALTFPKNILFPLLKSSQIAQVTYDEKHFSIKEILNNDEITIIPGTSLQSPALIQYTGGTTGIPKGAVLTHENLYVNVMQCSKWFKIGQNGGLEQGNEKMMGVLPFFHVFAMTTVMNLSICNGFEIIIHPRFELEKVIKDIEKKKPTLMPGVPTMYTAMNNYKDIDKYDISSIKACISGGSALPIEVKNKFEYLTGCKLIEGYGLTETSPVIAANPLLGKNKEGSIGLPMPATIIAIEDMDHKGRFVQPYVKGELCVKGPQIMKGYLDNRAATEASFISGFLRTGDIAYIDDEGYIFIVDRLKEMIICGGFNVYPRNVEEAIYQHESVLEAAVIGVDDEYRGQSVKAFIALKDDAELSAEELKEFLSDKVGKHEMPEFIEFRDELPKTMIGKISKKDL